MPDDILPAIANSCLQCRLRRLCKLGLRGQYERLCRRLRRPLRMAGRFKIALTILKQRIV